MNLETHSGFQSAVKEYAELCGWTVWWTPDSRRTNAGEPDMRMVRKIKGSEGSRLIFAELKVGKDRVKPAQKDAAMLLLGVAGVEYYLWRPEMWESIEKVLR